jgi:hypothetical protein
MQPTMILFGHVLDVIPTCLLSLCLARKLLPSNDSEEYTYIQEVHLISLQLSFPNMESRLENRMKIKIMVLIQRMGL